MRGVTRVEEAKDVCELVDLENGIHGPGLRGTRLPLLVHLVSFRNIRPEILHVLLVHLHAWKRKTSRNHPFNSGSFSEKNEC